MKQRTSGVTKTLGRHKNRPRRLRGKKFHLFLRSHQADDYWPLYSELLKEGAIPQFIEIQRSRPDDDANAAFLANKGIPLFSTTWEEPQEFSASMVQENYNGFDIEGITKFARWRWRRGGAKMDYIILARTNWILHRYEKFFKENRPDYIVTWGDMAHDSAAIKALADKLKIPHLLFEGGFLPNSMCLDGGGMYYTPESDWNGIWENQSEPTADERIRIKKLMDQWRQKDMSKYNNKTAFTEIETGVDCRALAPKGKKIMLIVCQTTGDATMYFPRVLVDNKLSLTNLVLRTMAGMTDWHILVKPHPHERHDDLALMVNPYEGIDIIPKASPHSALRAADMVITINSTMGFEALGYGIPVITFGDNFYTGKGLTWDIRRADRRLKEQLRTAIDQAKPPDMNEVYSLFNLVAYKFLFLFGYNNGRLIDAAKSARQHCR